MAAPSPEKSQVLLPSPLLLMVMSAPVMVYLESTTMMGLKPSYSLLITRPVADSPVTLSAPEAMASATDLSATSLPSLTYTAVV